MKSNFTLWACFSFASIRLTTKCQPINRRLSVDNVVHSLSHNYAQAVVNSTNCGTTENSPFYQSLKIIVPKKEKARCEETRTYFRLVGSFTTHPALSSILHVDGRGSIGRRREWPKKCKCGKDRVVMNCVQT